MLTFHDRQKTVLQLAANKALTTPRLSSGLWFHDDMRNNLYYAMHLYVAACTEEIELLCPKTWAKEVAEEILLQLLQLQERNAEVALYGHFPLGLGTDPSQAKAHELPVELVGNLLVLLATKYESMLTTALKEQLHVSLFHIYKSGLAKVPQVYYHHHETKRFHLQINLGTYFDDQELIKQGHQHIRVILERVQTLGFQEYGILPWFWHWVQSASVVWETVKQEEVKETVQQLLNWLWTYRAEHYLQGAWIGARSRGWAHDIPADRNVLFDYIQFGDCPLPDAIVRLEAAGLIDYDAGEFIRSIALQEETTERVYMIPRPAVDEKQEKQSSLCEYVFKTKYYAVGGIQEYFREFDNEQLRYQITFPVRKDGTANQAYFFHPGQGYLEGDLRHASGCGEVLLYKQVAAILFPIPESERDVIVGSLPHGRWQMDQNCWVGDLNDIYLIIHIWQRNEADISSSGVKLYSSGRNNGVVMEVVTKEEAQSRGINTLDMLHRQIADNRAHFASDDKTINVNYCSFHGHEISLSVDRSNGTINRLVNAKNI